MLALFFDRVSKRVALHKAPKLRYYEVPRRFAVLTLSTVNKSCAEETFSNRMGAERSSLGKNRSRFRPSLDDLVGFHLAKVLRASKAVIQRMTRRKHVPRDPVAGCERDNCDTS